MSARQRDIELLDKHGVHFEVTPSGRARYLYGMPGHDIIVARTTREKAAQDMVTELCAVGFFSGHATPIEKDELKFVRTVCRFAQGVLEEGSSEGRGFEVCWPLETYLKLSGYKVALVQGVVHPQANPAAHYWLECSNGKIIDPTADQFLTPAGTAMPPVYYGTKPDWYTTNYNVNGTSN